MKHFSRLLLFYAVLIAKTACSQDFFEDLRGGGIPVISRSNGKASLLSGRVNAGDNSLKINFFHIFRMHPDVVDPARISIPGGTGAPEEIRTEKSQGFGLSLKAKTEDGFGSIFSGSQFATGFSAGGYYAFRKVHVDDFEDKAEFSYWIFSGTYNRGDYRFYRPALPLSSQLSGYLGFNGFHSGVSHFHYFTSGKNREDGHIGGGSLGLSTRNNYGSLDKVEVKRIKNTVFGAGKDSIQTVALLDDASSIYALEAGDSRFDSYLQMQLRGYYAYIPGSLDNRIAILVYPTANYNLEEKVLSADFSLGFHFLKKGQPTISIGGVFFEFDDVFNAAKSTSPLVARSFHVGVMIGLNILSNTAR